MHSRKGNRKIVKDRVVDDYNKLVFPEHKTAVVYKN